MANATIRDVARQADVSVASVSRVINGSDSVSDDVRQRVREAIDALGYIPHAGARSLSLARTNAVGVMLPAFHGEFFSEVVRGMDLEATRHGYLLLLSNLRLGDHHTPDALNAMRGRVDGLVMMAPHLDSDEVAAVLPRGMPTVLINSRATGGGAGSIQVDNAFGSTKVIDHLREIGRRRIVHIAGPDGNVDAQDRCRAYLDAAKRHQFEPVIVKGDFMIESGGQAVRELLHRGTSFDAIFAANDNMAIGAIEALRDAGFAVPDDVAVAGFDDIPLATHVGITTVKVGIADMGERALAKLMAALAGSEDHSDEFHRPELVVRWSTGGNADA